MGIVNKYIFCVLLKQLIKHGVIIKISEKAFKFRRHI